MASNFNLGIDFDSPSLDFIDQFINDQKSKSTTNKEKYDLKNFSSFCQANFQECRSIESIPSEKLDNLLCHFFIKARTKQGKLYEPDTLNSIRNSLQRVLIEKGSKINLKDDMEFCKSRKVLTARRKQLTKLGKGNKPNATRALTEKEVDLLYSSNYFGSSTPMSLQRTIWWIITTNFGHRARNEARQLLFGDIKIKISEGNEYLEWDTERATKTRDGSVPMGHKRAFNPTAFATETERCPVSLYKKFISHRPDNMCQDASPLFLAINYHVDYNLDPVWYLPRPLGKNKIGEFLPGARKILVSSGECTTKGKISNHSARKTTITNLLDNNINPLYVQQLSGHKRMESLNTYHVPSFKQQKEMSHVVSGYFNKSSNSPKCCQESSETNNKNSQNDINNICPSLAEEMSKPWDPVNLLNMNSFVTKHPAPIFNNCTFNFGIMTTAETAKPLPPKRRRVLINDSSDDEN